MCLSCHNWAASENSDAKEKKERWGFWFAGFATGPDTVNATFWSVAILALAVSGRFTLFNCIPCIHRCFFSLPCSIQSFLLALSFFFLTCFLNPLLFPLVCVAPVSLQTPSAVQTHPIN